MNSADQGTRAATGLVDRRVRGRFRLVWMLPVAGFLALLAWAFASPISSAPDDDYHLVSVWCEGALPSAYCAPGPSSASQPEEVVPSALLSANCFAFKADVSAACQSAIFARPLAPQVVSSRGNFSALYPPLYYAVMHPLAGPDVQVSALWMRVLNIALFVGLSALAGWLLTPSRRQAMLVMWLLTLVPLGMFLVASNNPSSWAVTGVGLSWITMLGFFEASGWRKAALGTISALTAVMASGARADAAVFVVVGFGIAAVLAAERRRSFWWSLALPVALALAAGLFFLSAHQSDSAVTGMSGAGATTAGEFIRQMVANLLEVPSLLAGAFGVGFGLGWLDTPLPAIVGFGTIAVFAGVGVWSFAKLRVRQGVLILLLGILVWVLPAYMLTASGSVVGQNVQPRYLLPLIVMLAGLVVLGWRREPLRPSLPQALVIGVFLVLADCFALNRNMRRYESGLDVGGLNLDAHVEWWWPQFPLSPNAVWIVGTVAFAAAVAIILVEWRRRITSGS